MTKLTSPTGIHIDLNGNLFITDIDNNLIQKWTPGATEGITVAGGNGQGAAADQLNYPTDIYVDDNETIFVADCRNHRIQKLVPDDTEGITVI